MSNLKHIPTLVVTEGPGTDNTPRAGEGGNPPAGADEIELAKLIVATLNLDVVAAHIEPDAPLYRDGLGLDSIDVLELALAISKKYGLNVRSDDENNLTIFSSLRSLNRHIQQHRSK